MHLSSVPHAIYMTVRVFCIELDALFMVNLFVFVVSIVAYAHSTQYGPSEYGPSASQSQGVCDGAA
jgi:hypothetical protein